MQNKMQTSTSDAKYMSISNLAELTYAIKFICQIIKLKRETQKDRE
jgi:hypothetical protein